MKLTLYLLAGGLVGLLYGGLRLVGAEPQEALLYVTFALAFVAYAESAAKSDDD